MLTRRNLLATTSAAVVTAAEQAVAAVDTMGKSNKKLAREYYLVIDKNGIEAGEGYGNKKYNGANHSGFPADTPGGLGKVFYAAFPDFTHEIIEQIGEGDIVVERIRYFATHKGTFMGVPATGKTITFTGMDWVKFEGGQVVERWGVADEAELHRQLIGEPDPKPLEKNKTLAKEFYDTIDHFGTGAGKAYGAPGSHYYGSNYQGMGRTNPHYTAFPDYTHLIEDQVAEDDIVVERIRYFATHKDWFLGLAPTGRQFSYTGMDWVKFMDHRSVDRWGAADGIGLRHQLTGEAMPPKGIFEFWPKYMKE